MPICTHLACFSGVFSRECKPNNWNGCSECCKGSRDRQDGLLVRITPCPHRFPGLQISGKRTFGRNKCLEKVVPAMLIQMDDKLPGRFYCLQVANMLTNPLTANIPINRWHLHLSLTFKLLEDDLLLVHTYYYQVKSMVTGIQFGDCVLCVSTILQFMLGEWTS